MWALPARVPVLSRGFRGNFEDELELDDFSLSLAFDSKPFLGCLVLLELSLAASISSSESVETGVNPEDREQAIMVFDGGWADCVGYLQY